MPVAARTGDPGIQEVLSQPAAARPAGRAADEDRGGASELFSSFAPDIDRNRMENVIMKMPGLHRRQEGFTLPEVMIALVVLTVGLLGMAALTGSIVSAGGLSKDRVAATTFAQSKIEELKNSGISSLTGGSDSQGAFSRTWSVSPDDPIAKAANISVTVSWWWAGATRTVLLRTIRAE